MNRTRHHVRNARVEIAWHRREAAGGHPLLLLHALYGSAEDWPDDLVWSGPVHAIDFSGHGDSDWVRGGGYSPELFVADADAVLREITAGEGEGRGEPSVTIAGAGIGAYVALLLAGARPALVRAALLGPGAGLGETDGEPDFERKPERIRDSGDVPEGCDPGLWAFFGEMKPRDYVESFARRAPRLWLLDDGGARPAWWAHVRETGQTELTGPDWATALAAVARS